MRIGLKLVSVFLAIILWFYVNIVISPEVRRTVTAHVEYKNLPPLLRVSPKKAETLIQLKGARRDFIFAGKDSVQVTVDLYNLRPGPAIIPLKVTSPSGIHVEGMKPGNLDIFAEALTRKEFEVAVDVRGQTAEGFISEAPLVNPRKVILEGTREMIDKVAGCQVSVMLVDARNSLSELRKVQVLGSEGPIESAFTVIPEKVDVTVTVKSGYPSKNVPVVSQALNKPPEGYKLDEITIQPATVTISGPARVLEQVREVRTMVDLSMARGTSSMTARLEPPFESVSFVGSGSVEVEVQMTPIMVTREFNGFPITVRKSSNQHCIVTPSSYSLVLKGYVPDLEKVTGADMEVVLDVRGKAPGTCTVDIVPHGLPDRLQTLEIHPPKAEVEISEAESRPTASATGP